MENNLKKYWDEIEDLRAIEKSTEEIKARITALIEIKKEAAKKHAEELYFQKTGYTKDKILYRNAGLAYQYEKMDCFIFISTETQYKALYRLINNALIRGGEQTIYDNTIITLNLENEQDNK